MTLFPLIKRKIELKTTDKQFIQALRVLTEEGFDFTRVQEESPVLFASDNNKQYVVEIYTNYFRARRLDEFGSQDSFINNTIYGKFTQTGEVLTFSYIITFNIFTSILFLLMLFLLIYSLCNNWLYMLFLYPMFVVLFNSGVSDDKKFILKLITLAQSDKQSKSI